jgi:hypothetical protein
LADQPCRVRGRDIPQDVWEGLNLPPLLTRPPLKFGRAYGWVVSTFAPRKVLRWFE